MDSHLRGRRTPRLSGRLALAAASAAAAAASFSTSNLASAAVAAAVVSVPGGEPLGLPALAVRALEVTAIGSVQFHRKWQRNGTACPRDIIFGSGTAVPDVPPSDARFFAGDAIREQDVRCQAGGLLAVTVETLLSDTVMARLGHAGIAEGLTSDEWSAGLLKWAALVGLRMPTWHCAGLGSWWPTAVAYFGDAGLDVSAPSGDVTTLPAGHRHMMVTFPGRIECIYSALPVASAGGDTGGGTPGGDTDGGTPGGDTGGGTPVGDTGTGGRTGRAAPDDNGDELSGGAITGVVLAVLAVVAAAIATVVMVVKRKRRRQADGGQGVPHEGGQRGSAPPLPASLPFPPPPVSAVAPGHPGGQAAGVPWTPAPPAAAWTTPVASAGAAPPAQPPGGGTAAEAARRGATPPPSSRGTTEPSTSTGDQ